MRQGIHDSGIVLRRAWRFFLRRYPIIFGFGLLAALQRFLSVAGGERFAFAGGVGGEIFTTAVRLGFVVWLVVELIRPREDSVSTGGWRIAIRSLVHRPWLHLCWLVGVALLSLVFKVGLDVLGHALPTPELRQTFLAWELAIKNVTVIAFTMVWLVTQIGELWYPTRRSVEAQEVSSASDRG